MAIPSLFFRRGPQFSVRKGRGMRKHKDMKDLGSLAKAPCVFCGNTRLLPLQALEACELD